MSDGASQPPPAACLEAVELKVREIKRDVDVVWNAARLPTNGAGPPAHCVVGAPYARHHQLALMQRDAVGFRRVSGRLRRVRDVELSPDTLARPPGGVGAAAASRGSIVRG